MGDVKCWVGNTSFHQLSPDNLHVLTLFKKNAYPHLFLIQDLRPVMMVLLQQQKLQRLPPVKLQPLLQ